MFQFLTKIPEGQRGWLYLGMAIVGLGTFVALLVVDVMQGGDPGEWIIWLAGALGVGNGIAAANTPRPPIRKRDGE